MLRWGEEGERNEKERNGKGRRRGEERKGEKRGQSMKEGKKDNPEQRTLLEI